MKRSAEIPTARRSVTLLTVNDKEWNVLFLAARSDLTGSRVGKPYQPRISRPHVHNGTSGVLRLQARRRLQHRLSVRTQCPAHTSRATQKRRLCFGDSSFISSIPADSVMFSKRVEALSKTATVTGNERLTKPHSILRIHMIRSQSNGMEATRNQA